MDFNRIPFIGAYSICTDKICLIPERVYLRPDNTSVLGVPVIRASVSASPLLGILLAGNSHVLLCSGVFELRLGSESKEHDLDIEYVPGKHTALGNLVLANDKGAIASPELPTSVIKHISNCLGVEVVQSTIAGHTTVGAVAVATNRGALLHPDASESEAELVEDVLGVPADVGTACSGVRFIGLCVIANSKGALAGSLTTGPELGKIESALGFVEAGKR
jgi:translation initiation factor 6